MDELKTKIHHAIQTIDQEILKNDLKNMKTWLPLLYKNGVEILNI